MPRIAPRTPHNFRKKASTVSLADSYDGLKPAPSYDPNHRSAASAPVLGEATITRIRKANGEFEEIRRIAVPVNRLSPLKAAWVDIVRPLVDQLKIQVRMNPRKRCIEMRNGPSTSESASLQKASEYLKAFMVGFALEDALALLRLDDLFLENFEMKDVKMLKGDHIGRAIGRVVGKDGKTRNAIENATRTRIVVAGERIHLLGSFANVKVARSTISQLIMGSAPSKVYDKLRTVGKRLKERI